MISIKLYSGTHKGNYKIYISNDNKNFEGPLEFDKGKVYAWSELGIGKTFEYIKFVPYAQDAHLGEIGLYNENYEQIDAIPLNDNAKLILDEQGIVPREISYMNSSYFDEIYFPRTASEYLQGLQIYEWTHPPLGKLILTIPIFILGLTPFAYRLFGNIAGILMILIIYVIAKMMFKKTKYAALAGILLAADGMHFVQTRIGTVDSFLILFIMLAYLFMYKYVISYDKTLNKRLWALFWSGLFIGLAIAVKWIGLFAGAGLAVIFFSSVFVEIFIKKRKWNKDYEIIFLSCILFFIIIPMLIYGLSYLPEFFIGNSKVKDFKSLIILQQKMYDYHHDLEATHTYSSKWYTWPVTAKDILYWSSTTIDGKVSRIVLLGNPIVFWVSVPCMIYTVVLSIWKRKFKYWFLIASIICLITPYILIPRIMFLYHYFSVLPFAILSIVAAMEWLCEKIKNNIPIWVLAELAILGFIVFYPIYSGLPVNPVYIQDLKWLKTWVW